MSDGPGRPTARDEFEVVGGLSAAWWRSVDNGRSRTSRLREIQRADGSTDERSRLAIQELQVAYEELSVAEDELRAQNDALVESHGMLEAERVRYRTLFEMAPIPYFVTDASGTISDANVAGSRLLRCRADRLDGKPLAVFTRGTARQRLRDAVGELNAGAPTVTLDLEIVGRDNTLVPVEATASAVRGPHGRLCEIRWLLVDQRPRRKRNQLRRERADELEALVSARTADLARAQHMKDQLVAVVSHELRTPLAAIAGFTELLSMGLRGPLSEEQKLDIDRIHRAYEQMARVVDDLLSYSKVAAGHMAFEIRDAPLRGQVRLVLELVAQPADERGVSIVVSEAPVDALIRVDAERVRQILLNLVSNAIKYTPEGGSVSVNQRLTDTEAIIEVSDTGPGVPADQRERIFEPFVRLSRDDATPGTGLGLAISREMARAMGGDLTIADRVGPGTCFTLRLPLSTGLAALDASG